MRICTALLALGLVSPELAARESFDAFEVASELAEVGSRSSHREPAHQSAQASLLEYMRVAGLEGVGHLPVGAPDVFNLTGILPGSSGLQVILSAHYDSVKESPGAIDDASGCGVVLEAAAKLSRTPRRHEIRVILFDQEEAGAKGSRLWLDEIGQSRRDAILANINVDMVGWSGGRPVILAIPGQRAGRLEQTPAWLIHAVMKGTHAAGSRLTMFDDSWPLMMQIVLRTQKIRYGADSDAFLQRQVPSLTLSDSPLFAFDPLHHSSGDRAERLDRARLSEWVQAVTATVRRLDNIRGRPAADDKYLVVLGRVWPRKQLYWTGFLIWIILVFKGVPGRWVSTSTVERARTRMRYLPGFIFRMLFLLSVFLTPVLATVLLYPAGVAYTGIGRRGQRWKIALFIGLFPITMLSGIFVMAWLQEVTSGWPVLWWPLLLNILVLTAYYFAVWQHLGIREELVAGSSDEPPSASMPQAGSRAIFETTERECPEASIDPSSPPDVSPRKP